MKPIYVVLIIVVIILILIYGSNQGWFKSKEVVVVPNPPAIPRPLPVVHYVAGQTYTDPETGGEIACYTRQPGSDCNQTIFKPDTNPPVEGTLFATTTDACCYLFPAQVPVVRTMAERVFNRTF